MSKENLTPLKNAEAAYEGQKIISIIGSPKTGKTVVGALLLEAIVNKFLQENSNYVFRIKKGINYMKTNSIALKEGNFPEKTAESEIKQVEMSLTQNKASGGEIELRLNDIAGELSDYFLTKEIVPSTLATRIIDHEKPKGAKFGPFSFLIFSKVYTFLIDCDKIKDWNKESFDNMILINNILALKKLIGESDDNKIHCPIAIMFTKTDLLDEENRTLETEKLLEKYMPEFYNQMKGIVTGNIGFFKVFIDVERGPDNKPIKIEIKPENPVTTSVEAGAKITEAIKPKITYKVKVPLSYNEDEYVKFISWLDENLCD